MTNTRVVATFCYITLYASAVSYTATFYVIIYRDKKTDIWIREKTKVPYHTCLNKLEGGNGSGQGT